MKEPFPCLIPAAGLSSRMGEWKPGKLWGETPLVKVVVGIVLQANCRPIVIGGYRYEDLRRLLNGMGGVEVCHAPDWELGMGASLRHGIKLIDREAFFVLPADMPLVHPNDFRRIQRFWESADATIACRPRYNGIPGHPVLFPSHWIPEILDAPSGQALKEFLDLHEIMELQWNHEGVIADMDRPDQWT